MMPPVIEGRVCPQRTLPNKLLEAKTAVHFVQVHPIWWKAGSRRWGCGEPGGASLPFDPDRGKDYVRRTTRAGGVFGSTSRWGTGGCAVRPRSAPAYRGAGTTAGGGTAASSAAPPGPLCYRPNTASLSSHRHSPATAFGTTPRFPVGGVDRHILGSKSYVPTAPPTQQRRASTRARARARGVGGGIGSGEEGAEAKHRAPRPPPR